MQNISKVVLFMATLLWFSGVVRLGLVVLRSNHELHIDLGIALTLSVLALGGFSLQHLMKER